MIIKKRFAQCRLALDDCMDQLIEVLAQLLEETQSPAALAAGGQAAVPAMTDLPSRADGVIHVVANNSAK